MMDFLITNGTNDWVDRISSFDETEQNQFNLISQEELIERSTSEPSKNRLIVLGPESSDIKAILNHIHHANKDQMVYVFQNKDQLNEAKQQLMYLPFSGKSTKIFDAAHEPEMVLRKYIESKGLQRHYETIVDVSNSRIQNMEAFQVRAQKVLGHIMQRLPIGVFIVDDSDKVTSVNVFGTQILGKTEDDILGLPFSKLFATSEIDKINRALHQNVEVEIQHTKNGETSYFILTLSDINDHENVVVLNNVTEQRKSIMAMEQLTYIASHDLQEPLRSIQGMTNMLISEYSEKMDEPGARMVGYVNNAAIRMGELIRSVLEFSKIGQEKTVERIDMNVLVDQVSQDLSFKIDEVEGSLSYDKLDAVYGNPVEIGLVLQNLIGNALKFRAGDRKPEVKVRSIQRENEIEFRVEDNGIGIPQDQLENVFIIFRRLNNASDFEGTGIGLTHCKKIVEAHDGRIWAESELNQGSSFCFSLPILH